jgi:serine/threonine-protein kinase RsbW
MVRRAIHSIATNLGFSEEVAEDIELSVDEALVNAIEHGSPEKGKNNVIVACKVSENKLTIDVCDEGPGFDSTSFFSPSNPLDERGRGLTLIYNLMDNVELSSTRRGARIRMVKAKNSFAKRIKLQKSPSKLKAQI